VLCKCHTTRVRAGFLLYNILFSQLIYRLTGEGAQGGGGLFFITAAIIADSGPGMG
jgi:hypothetical protein